MESPSVSAVLFVQDLQKVADFYAKALGFTRVYADEHHSRMTCCGFDLIVHRIPRQSVEHVSLEAPPERRVFASIRLNFPVRDVQECRRLARLHGGDVDDEPPAWADPKADVFLGYDPEGNVFKITQHRW